MKTIQELNKFHSMLKKATTKVTKTEKLNYINVYFYAYTEGEFTIIEEVRTGNGNTTRTIYSISSNKVPADVFSDIKSGKYNYTISDMKTGYKA